MDSVATSITLHSDGKVLIEGKGGVVIDSASAKLELKGGEVSIAATSGVKIDGGSGAVNVDRRHRAGAEGHLREARGQRQAEVKAGGVLTVQGSLVKIN